MIRNVSIMVVCVLLACAKQGHGESAEQARPRQPWGKALVSVHATADDAIDANNLLAARAALTSGLSMSTSAPARQDLLQRLAWVELNLGLAGEARTHADQAIALEDDDERGYANALVVRHLIAAREGDQKKIDSLTEDLLHALDPN